MKKRKKMKPVTAWAWAIKKNYGDRAWELCFWAEPTRDRLESRSPPTPNARAVRVRITEAPKKRRSKKP